MSSLNTSIDADDKVSVETMDINSRSTFKSATETYVVDAIVVANSTVSAIARSISDVDVSALIDAINSLIISNSAAIVDVLVATFDINSRNTSNDDADVDVDVDITANSSFISSISGADVDVVISTVEISSCSISNVAADVDVVVDTTADSSFKLQNTG